MVNDILSVKKTEDFSSVFFILNGFPTLTCFVTYHKGRKVVELDKGLIFDMDKVVE